MLTTTIGSSQLLSSNLLSKTTPTLDWKPTDVWQLSSKWADMVYSIHIDRLIVYLPFNSLSQIDFENYMNANKQTSCPHGQIRTQGALSSKFNGGFQHDGTNQCSNPHKLISSLCATIFVSSKRWKMLDYQSNTCAYSAFVRGYPADYLCTSIYFHSTFVPNILDSSSWTRYPIQK